VERELERIVVKYRVQRTKKKQMRLFLEMGLTLHELDLLLRRRLMVLDHRPSTIRKKFEFLIEHTKMNKTQFIKFFIKFPRILEYSMKKTVLPRLEYLQSIGFQGEDLTKILFQAPAVTELSVEKTLSPRVEFLRDTIGTKSELLQKTLLKHPHLLTYSEEGMSARVAFLQEWNLSADDIARMVTLHPQILHYSVQSMSMHIHYLLHLGIDRSSVQRIIVRFPQLLSLDLKANVIPKLRYLRSELGGTTETIENNPVFVGLSLKKRIIPRHRFLSSLQSFDVPNPFPINWFKCSDEYFANRVARVPLKQFIAFKEECLHEHI